VCTEVAFFTFTLFVFLQTCIQMGCQFRAQLKVDFICPETNARTFKWVEWVIPLGMGGIAPSPSPKMFRDMLTLSINLSSLPNTKQETKGPMVIVEFWDKSRCGKVTHEIYGF
jgi:hypothetical protein